MIIVRQEREVDLPDVREVLNRACGRSDEADLVDLVRESTYSFVALVATNNDQTVGYAMLTPVWVGDGPAPIGVGLGPVAVLPEHQGEGIGTALVRHALHVCRREGISVVVTLDYPGYFRRFGFTPATDSGLHSAYNAFDDTFMAIELDEDALSEISGTVWYLNAFAHA